MMVRSDLVSALRRDHPDLSAVEIANIVTCFFEAIAQCLAKNRRAELRGFGTFSTRVRDSRIGRNPLSGEAVQIDAERAVHFKPGKQILALLNDKRAGGS